MFNKKLLKKTVKKPTNKKKLTLSEKQLIKLKILRDRLASKLQKEPKNKSRFYCKPAEMQAELIKWRDSNIDEETALKKKGLPIDLTKRVISDELCRMLIAIADKLLNRSEFRNYSKELKEDAKSYFFYKALSSGLKNYNFNFNNPFSYFTTCAWNAYISIIMKHYRHQNTRRDVMMMLLSEIEAHNGIDPQSSLKNYIKQYLDNTYDNTNDSEN